MRTAERARLAASLARAVEAPVVDIARVRELRAHLAGMPDVQVDEAIDRAHLEREGRRLARQARRTGGQPRCGACHAYVTSATAQCPHCGFWPGRGWAA